VYTAIVFLPLLGFLIAGLFGKAVGRAGAHSVTILGVAIAFVLLLILLSLALSIALRPRGRDMPSVLSQSSSASVLDSRMMTV